MYMTTWLILKSDWLYFFCKWSWKSSIQSANTRPGAACGSHYELFIVKLRLKLKKLGKVNKPFKYDLNKIPSDYSVGETNRFKGLGLVDRVPEELWTEAHDIIQEAVSRTIPRKKECKKAKWLSEEVLHIAEERRETKSKWERKIYPIEHRIPENHKERLRGLLQWTMKRRGKQ